jgi:hypothetical protein
VSLTLRYKKTDDPFMPDQYSLFFKSSSDLPDGEVKSLHLAGHNLVVTYTEKFKISVIDQKTLASNIEVDSSLFGKFNINLKEIEHIVVPVMKWQQRDIPEISLLKLIVIAKTEQG